MAAVALVGPDGAGKTTIARKLAESTSLRCRYLYMGINLAASNATLPTARLAQRLKQRSRAAVADQRTLSAAGSPRRRNALRSAVRLAVWISEEWFRQIVSWYYQARGYIVVYDRHFLLDFAPELATGPQTLDRRLHYWLLRVYPRPDLVIYLDAPGELLFARKHESTIEELERRRRAFLRQGERLPAFVRVDATRPVEEVHAEVVNAVRTHCAQGRLVGLRQSEPRQPPPRQHANIREDSC